MTVNQLALSILSEQGDASDDADFVTQVETWVKDSLSEIADKCNFRHFQSYANITTVNGTPNYSLPIGVFDVKSFRIPSLDEEIEFKERDYLVALNCDLEELGRPKFWFYNQPVQDGADMRFEVRFYPIPNEVLTIEGHYLQDPSVLTSGSQILVQNYFLLLLKDRLRAYILEHDKDYDGSDRAYQRFMKELKHKVERENAKTVNVPRLKVSDISGRGVDRLTRFDPSHYNN